jgi:CheY-like chemotaxis protein
MPALVLLDLWMPVMDGRGFLAAYRQLPLPQAPVVLFAAALRKGGAPVDADAVLAKPFDLPDLLALVEHLIGRPRKPC